MSAVLTDQQAKALQIVADYEDALEKPPTVVGGIRPREFSQIMWPEADGHERGDGGRKGAVMYLAAGGYLGKLTVAGLLRKSEAYVGDNGYMLTTMGRRALKKYDKQRPKEGV